MAEQLQDGAFVAAVKEELSMAAAKGSSPSESWAAKAAVYEVHADMTCHCAGQNSSRTPYTVIQSTEFAADSQAELEFRSPAILTSEEEEQLVNYAILMSLQCGTESAELPAYARDLENESPQASFHQRRPPTMATPGMEYRRTDAYASRTPMQNLPYSSLSAHNQGLELQFATPAVRRGHHSQGDTAAGKPGEKKPSKWKRFWSSCSVQQSTFSPQDESDRSRAQPSTSQADRRRQAGLLIKALRGKTPEMLEMLDASTATLAVRQVHEYAATPIVPDDFGPEGPLQEGAPRSPHTPAAIPTVDINDFVPDIDYELQESGWVSDRYSSLMDCSKDESPAVDVAIDSVSMVTKSSSPLGDGCRMHGWSL